MRCLVTGGNGFIGSHLVKKLEEEGRDVEVMDFPFDITEKTAWIMKLRDIDFVFHLAGYLDNYEQKTEYAKYLDVNVKSVALMFEVIKEYEIPIKKIIVASSQSVYGEGKDKKEDDVLVPLSMYGASKAAMEDVLMMLGRIHNIPVAALRYSIVLGAGQQYKDADSRILPCFVDMARKGKIITHEDGQQLRDFVHLQDVVDATVFAADTAEGIFNIGSGQETSVMEVAEYIAGKFSVSASAGGKKRINTARNQTMNIEKIKSLGWTPKLSWKNAVDDFIASQSPSAGK